MTLNPLPNRWQDASSRESLKQQLNEFEIDPPEARLGFAARLARENDWSQDFAERVVREYKRYLFLAVTAGAEMTPSDAVDQAWHLHLTYTRSYWRDLCGELLGTELHHLPTQGGPSERTRFRQQYLDTLAQYRDAFGEDAPTDIWPSAEQRFNAANRFVRLNLGNAWLLPKPDFRMTSPRLAVLAAATALLASCTAADDSSTMLTIALSVVGLVGAVLAYKWMWSFSKQAEEAKEREKQLAEERESKKKEGGKGDGGDAGCGSGCGGG